MAGRQQGLVFSPNFKFSYDFTKKIAGGVEYYGSLGPSRASIQSASSNSKSSPLST